TWPGRRLCAFQTLLFLPQHWQLVKDGRHCEFGGLYGFLVPSEVLNEKTQGLHGLRLGGDFEDHLAVALGGAKTLGVVWNDSGDLGPDRLAEFGGGNLGALGNPYLVQNDDWGTVIRARGL